MLPPTVRAQPPARVLSVNVGAPREIEWDGEIVITAIWKSPVAGRVAVHGVNLAGDDQADRTVHGGPDKAVYAYTREDYDWWRESAGLDVSPALFGENLTIEGHDLTAAIIGERWRVGSAILEVAQPRMPCYKLGIRVNDQRFLKTFLLARRPGAYLRIVREGDVAAGDGIEVEHRPDHAITIGDMVDALRDPKRAAALHRIPDLPAFWRRVAARA